MTRILHAATKHEPAIDYVLRCHSLAVIGYDNSSTWIFHVAQFDDAGVGVCIEGVLDKFNDTLVNTRI